VREITEFAAWLIETYKGSPKSLTEVWAYLVRYFSTEATGSDATAGRVTYTIPLPATLAPNAPWKEQKFISSGSRQRSFSGMDKMAIDELFRVLINTLNRDLMTGLDPERLLSTGNAKCENTKEKTKRLILIGGSHLRRTIPHLSRMGYGITDVTCPGRTISAASVELILNQLNGQEVLAEAVMVFDLLRNSSFRWEHEDGTLVMAVRVDGGYHMQGPVTVCSDATFKRLLQIMSPIIQDAAGLGKIFIPPLPRYLYGGCCTNSDHCSNVGETNHAMTLLGKVDHLRALLKAELAKQGVVKHWVMEGWKDVIGTRGSSREDDLVALRHVSGSDNVHYTRDGYENLAGSIHGTIHSRESVSASCNVAGTGPTRSRQTFFWRGFVSPNGSTRPRHSATSYNNSKRGRMHPYRGKGRKN
jgi:hypothetical protein